MNVISNIQGAFERELYNKPMAPCWKSLGADQSEEAGELQKILNEAKDNNYTGLNEKINEYAKQGHFFRLTEGKFYEVLPGNYKQVAIKIQVRNDTITWYFANCGHDETTQVFRNQIFRTASLGHLLVPGACAKYYRGTNSMHVKRMHTSEEQSKINHNHYRVHDNHVTPAQFEEHLRGFLKAQIAYGFKGKFIDEEEVQKMIEEYKKFDEKMEQKLPGENKTVREQYLIQEESKWTEKDKLELQENKFEEEPCDAQEIILPLNQGPLSVKEGDKKIAILPKEWVNHSLDQEALNQIAKVGSAGLRSDKAHTRQIKNSTLPKLKNAYTKLGELFEQHQYKGYPPLEKTA